MYTLSEEKFDLLQPEGLPAFKPASGAVEATTKALSELKGVVDNHLKVIADDSGTLKFMGACTGEC